MSHRLPSSLAIPLPGAKNAIHFLVLTSLLAPGLFAQSDAGATLNGTVADPSGAFVAGAKVTIKSAETGFTRAMQTTAAGLYSFNRIPVSKYDITVEMAGFKSIQQKDIPVSVGSVITLDLRLEIGQSSETISVTGESPVIETTRTNTATTVSSKQILELPVNGRNFIDFTTLTPGVVKDPTRGGDLSFGGQRGPNNSVLIDGADSNNLFYGQATGRTGFRPYAFSEDAVQEFQVNANSFPAEVGRASGGVVNAITRSGTNQLHGTAFEFFRDKGLNANTLINNNRGLVKSPYHFNQFGGTLGGPIKKDKLFFFLSYDAQRNLQSQIVIPNIAPNAAQSVVFSKYLKPYNIGLKNDVGLVKVDWNASNKDRFTLRYNLSRYTGINQESFGAGIAEEHSGNNEVNTDNIAAVYTRSVGTNMVFEGRFNFVQDKQPGFANTTGPEVAITNGVTFGANNFSPRFTNTRAKQPIGNLTYVRGKHTYKMGFDFNFVNADNYFPGFFAGGYTYASYDAFINNTPLNFRQAFPGSGAEFPQSHPNVKEYALFVQDSWRATERLTLNYGVRHDYFRYGQPNFRNPNAQLAAANLRTDQIPTDKKNFAPRVGFAYRATQSDRVVIRGGYGIYYSRTPGLLLSTAILNNGFASQTYLVTANPPTYPNVLKAAPIGTVFPDIYVTDPNFKTGRTQQFSLQTEIAVGKQSSVTIGYLGVNGSHLTRTRDINLFPSIATAGFICASPTSTLPCNTGTPTTYYRHVAAAPGGNTPARPNGAFGRISLFDSGGNSIYHGGFVQFQRRFAQRFQLQTSYTWSKVLDTTPDGTSVVPGNAGDDSKVAQDTLLPNLDRGPGQADIRNKFVFSGIWDISYANSLSNNVAKQILNHWQLSLISQALSGRAYQEIASGDAGNDGNQSNDRAPGVGRNTYRGPEFATVDVRLTKELTLHERVKLRLIGEAFNLTNRANITGINTTHYAFSGGSYRPLATYGAVTAVGDPRIAQLALKIVF